MNNCFIKFNDVCRLLKTIMQTDFFNNWDPLSYLTTSCLREYLRFGPLTHLRKTNELKWMFWTKPSHFYGQGLIYQMHSVFVSNDKRRLYMQW